MMESPDSRPDSSETLDLLERLGRGDPTAAEDLLARHRKELRDFVELHMDRKCRARFDASDVIQEAQLAIANRLGDYLARRPMPFHLWIRKTAFERMLNMRRDNRAARRDVNREVMKPDHPSSAVARSIVCSRPGPRDVVEAQEYCDKVAAVVAELPEADRTILTMRHVSQLPYGEVGELLEIDAVTARQRYGRALIRLQRLLVARGLLRVPK